MRRIRSHPDFKLEGRSKHFQSFWELELTPGEETCPHQHYESEELIYLLSGRGLVRVAHMERAVQPGEVVLVPPRTDHIIANPSDHLVRAITVESRLDLGDEEDELEEKEDESELEESTEEEKDRSARTIDTLVEQLPRAVDEAVAIKTILELFDIGGSLSELIENSLGFDNPKGLSAVREIERRIMRAVVEISGRYQFKELQDRSDWLCG